MANGIYALISKERLNDILQTLYSFTGIPIQLVDPQGASLETFGRAAYCGVLGGNPPCGDSCAELLSKASLYAQQSGDTYIFSCHAGLDLIAFPLTNKGDILGSVIVGPFQMDRPDHTILAALAEEFFLPAPVLLKAYDALSDMRPVPPSQVNDLSKLLSYLLSPLIPSERALLLQAKEKLSQQSRINETIQLYKEQGVVPNQNHFYHQEADLLSKVKNGNLRDARALLNETIGYMLFSDGRNIEAIRTRATDLTIQISHIALESGARADDIYELNSRFLRSINQENNLEELCFLLQDVIEGFMSTMTQESDRGNHHIRQALQFMAENYVQQITLEMVAEHVGLSPSYFSTLFRRTTGSSFRSYLCRIRVEESKHLLLHTEYSLSDIAVAVGFTDQSYYSRVFKRIVGITPGKYRN